MASSETDAVEYEEAARLYKWHKRVTVLLSAVVLFIGTRIASRDDFSFDLLLYSAIALPGLFLVSWLTAVLFKRKSRPWHFRKHPDDRKPFSRG